MKRAYVKPQILFEDFSLCTNIAIGCEHIANHTENQCAYVTEDIFGVGKLRLFSSESSGCADADMVTDGQYNGICYHNPTDSSNVFSS